MKISLRVFVRLVLTIYTVESVAGIKMHGDQIEVYGLQKNDTALKIIVKVKVWKFGGQLEHRCSSSLEFIVFSLLTFVLSVTEERALRSVVW